MRQSCGGLALDLASAQKDAEALAQILYCSNLLSGIEGDGVAEVLGIGSGIDGRFSVAGRLVAPSARLTFTNTGTEFAFDSAGAREGSAIAHAWAAMRVAQLSPRADDNTDELLKLGRRFGVVSPATSLLVLESLDQWLEYDIEPPKTWKKMHFDWVRHRRGMMQLSSEEEIAAAHLRNLKRAWADLLAWWKRDYPMEEPRHKGNYDRGLTLGSIGEDALPGFAEDVSVREHRAESIAFDGAVYDMECMASPMLAEDCAASAPCEAPLPVGQADFGAQGAF